MINDLTGLSSSQTASSRARTSEQGNTTKSGGDTSAQQSPSNKGDTVNLSNAAQILQNADKLLAETPDVDSARVERLKQDIESGNYQVNAERVAEQMLNFDNLL